MKPQSEVYLAGYSDKLSARPGETVRFHVSSQSTQPVEARLWQSICADPNPDGPGIDEVDGSDWFTPLSFPSRRQSWDIGSWAVSSATISIPAGCHELQVFVWCYPTRIPCPHMQCLWTLGPLDLSLTSSGFLQLRLSGKIVLFNGANGMKRCKWYRCCLTMHKEAFFLTFTTPGETSPQIVKATVDPFLIDPLFRLQDCYFSLSTGGTFNGKLEAPMVLVDGGDMLCAWDLSDNMKSCGMVPPSGPQGGALLLKNAPTRAVKGRRWDASEMNWEHKPSHYAAIYFHDDDVYEFNWDADFEWNIPEDCPSQVFVMHIQVEDHYDAMPIFVCPPIRKHDEEVDEDERPRLCVLVSTFTYTIYGNQTCSVCSVDPIRYMKAYPHYPAMHKDYGLSAHDRHSDGRSGICYASHKRPLFNLRPGFQTFGDTKCSGLLHFPADSHLIAWLHYMDIQYDIITDDELDREGLAAIQGYQCVITGTHPECHTRNTLDALQQFRDVSAGNLIYTGAGGFYWKIVRNAEHPSMLEIRRSEGGIRPWASEPGEYYSAFDGTYGGLWQRNGRPPEQLVGIGFTAQGDFVAGAYQRVCDKEEFDWVFDEMEDHGEVLGKFGFSGGGAAGFKLDRVINPDSTEEWNITILAQSARDYRDKLVLVPEQVLLHVTNISGVTEDEARRADMIHMRLDNGAQVFSAGSTCFCGSLPWNEFDNDISTLLGNIVRRFIALRP